MKIRKEYKDHIELKNSPHMEGYVNVLAGGVYSLGVVKATDEGRIEQLCRAFMMGRILGKREGKG